MSEWDDETEDASLDADELDVESVDLEEDEAPPSSAQRSIYRRYPRVARLTADEEAELAGRIAGGDRDAEARLVEAHLYLAIGIAKRYQDRGVPLLDLIQEGSIGLLVAARRWVPGPARFATYAEHWVRHYVRLAVLRTQRTIAVPAFAQIRRGRIERARADLATTLGRPPTDVETAGAAGLTAAQWRRSQPSLDAPIARASFDEPLNADDGRGLADVLADAQVPSPSRGAESVADVARLHRAMTRAGLTERERAVLWLRYGLDDEDRRTFAEIGEVLGIRHPSQLVLHEATALRKLRTALDGSGQPSRGSLAANGSPGSGSGIRAPGITRRGRRRVQASSIATSSVGASASADASS
jgi:RNA polymerase primary sigma factor